MRIKCPICKSPTTWEENPHRPFCSERCRMRDLGAWASGEYRVAGAPAGPELRNDDAEVERDADG